MEAFENDKTFYFPCVDTHDNSIAARRTELRLSRSEKEFVKQGGALLAPVPQGQKMNRVNRLVLGRTAEAVLPLLCGVLRLCGLLY